MSSIGFFDCVSGSFDELLYLDGISNNLGHSRFKEVDTDLLELDTYQASFGDYCLTVLKIISYLTVILPVVFLAGKLIYRACSEKNVAEEKPEEQKPHSSLVQKRPKFPHMEKLIKLQYAQVNYTSNPLSKEKIEGFFADTNNLTLEKIAKLQLTFTELSKVEETIFAFRRAFATFLLERNIESADALFYFQKLESKNGTCIHFRFSMDCLESDLGMPKDLCFEVLKRIVVCDFADYVTLDEKASSEGGGLAVIKAVDVEALERTEELEKNLEIKTVSPITKQFLVDLFDMGSCPEAITGSYFTPDHLSEIQKLIFQFKFHLSEFLSKKESPNGEPYSEGIFTFTAKSASEITFTVFNTSHSQRRTYDRTQLGMLKPEFMQILTRVVIKDFSKNVLTAKVLETQDSGFIYLRTPKTKS